MTNKNGENGAGKNANSSLLSKALSYTATNERSHRADRYTDNEVLDGLELSLAYLTGRISVAQMTYVVRKVLKEKSSSIHSYTAKMLTKAVKRGLCTVSVR